MRILYLMLVLLFLSACKSIYPANKSQKSDQWSPLTLEPYVEPYELRVDLIRQEDQTSNGESMSSSNRPYHPLAVHLGNGLILDRSMNLGLSILELFAIQPDEDFTIYQESVRFPGTPVRVFRCTGDHFESFKEALLPDRLMVDGRDSIIQIKSFLSNETIVQGDRIWTRKGFLTNDKMILHPDTICFRNIWQQCLTYQPGQVALKRSFTVQEDAQTWSILLNHQHWRLYREGQSIYFVNQFRRGYRITMKKDVLLIERNGRILWKYSRRYGTNNPL